MTDNKTFRFGLVISGGCFRALSSVGIATGKAIVAPSICSVCALDGRAASMTIGIANVSKMARLVALMRSTGNIVTFANSRSTRGSEAIGRNSPISIATATSRGCGFRS